MKRKLNNKGFSLVELLAVVVIIGILMALAIPTISRVIDDSRKKVYLDTVNIQVESIARLINADNYYVADENTVYYFDYRLGEEDGQHSESPFAEWLNCYVVVTSENKGKKLHYYWVGVDKAGWRIDLRRELEDMKTSDIYNLSGSDIIPGNSIGGRDNVVIYGTDNSTSGEVRESSNDVSGLVAGKCFSFKELDDGTYAITDYKTSCGTEANVPSSIDGKRVTIIDENAFRNKGLTKVTLYYGITELKNGAFQNNNITEVKLSSTIKIVGDYAFYQNKISKLDLPEGLERVKSYGFANNRISSISFPKTLKEIGYYAFHGNLLTEVDINSNPTIGGGSFSNNKMPASKAIIYKKKSDGTTDYSTIVGYGGEEKNLVIPDSVDGIPLKTIDGNAFVSCGLTSVVIPDSVTTIGGSAFYNNNLKEIKLPNSLTYIGGSAFRANWLSHVDIPPSVKTIVTNAFVQNCFPEGEDLVYARTSTGAIDYSTIVSAGGGRVNSAYSCNGARTLKIPAEKNGVKLKTILGSALNCCYYQNIVWPDLAQTDGLTIGSNAFYHNDFPDSERFIYEIKNGKYNYEVLASYGGRNRSGNLVIPGERNGVKLKTIQASFTWTSFKSIEIPESVTSLSGGIFSKSNVNNPGLVKIINKTGKAFNWYQLTGSTHSNPGAFVTGVVSHQSGDIEITDK